MFLRNNIMKQNVTGNNKSISDLGNYLDNYNSNNNTDNSYLQSQEYKSQSNLVEGNQIFDHTRNLYECDYTNPNMRQNIPANRNFHSSNLQNQNIANCPVTHMQTPNSICYPPSKNVAYQQYYNFNSSSSVVFPNEMNSVVNQGIEIQQNFISTTTLISTHTSGPLPSEGTYSKNHISAFCTTNSNNAFDSNGQMTFVQTACHTGLGQNNSNSRQTTAAIQAPAFNHLTNSFNNLTLNSSPTVTQWNNNGSNKSNIVCPDNFNVPHGPIQVVHHPASENNHVIAVNNDNAMPTNNSFNGLPSLNSSSRSLPQAYLNQNKFPNKKLISSPPMMSISSPAVVPNNYNENVNKKNHVPSKSSAPVNSSQTHSFSGYANNNLTPSRRMINIMEERVLIPTTGIMNPVPNLLHITKKNNCSPSIMRCTMNSVPCSEDILSKTRLPLAILIHPFKDLANLQVIKSKKIVRCRTLSCRAYLNPFVVFSDQKRWKCNLCQRINELTDDFLFDESMGVYIETQKRAEVKLATVEYIAPREYSIKNSQVLIYVFVVDISMNATSSLYSSTLSRIFNTIDELLERLPGHQHAKFALIGYDNHIHLYSIDERKCREMVISDISTPVEIPVTTGLLIDIHTYKDQIRELLTSLLENDEQYLPAQSNTVPNCLGTAVTFAKQLISNFGGRITIFNASCPSIGEGVLSIRETKKSSNFNPVTPDKEFYKSFSLECAQAQIGVDLFQLGKLPCDLASLSIITRFCGGSLFYYPDLTVSPSVNGKENMKENDLCILEVRRLLYDLNRYLTRKIGFDAVLRVRYSSGFSIQSSHGNFFARACDLYAMSNINPDSGIAVRLGISENFIENNVVFFQAALLYTSCMGERRIRVHTLCLPVSSQIDDIFRMADHQAIAGLLAKSVSDRLQSNGKILDAREALVNAIVDPSTAFGEFCLSSAQRLTSLPFPYHLRLLPLYVWGILQSKCLLTTRNNPDLSVAILDSWRNMPLSYLLIDLYPTLFNITSLAYLSCKQNEKFNSMLEVTDKSGSCSLADDVASYIDDTVERAYSSDSEASSWDSEACSGISCYDSRENVKQSDNNTAESDNDDIWYPEQLHLTIQSLSRTGVYLLESSRGLILLMGSDTPRSFFQCVFGVESFSELPSSGNIQLPELNNVASAQLRGFIKELQVERSLGSHLFIINNVQSNLNFLFQSHMLEDDKMDSSYQRFLKQIQRKINK